MGEKIKTIVMFSLFSASNGVVLATEKKQKSILYDEQSVHKVEPITKHIGMVYSGMGPDYRWEIIIWTEQYLRFPLVNVNCWAQWQLCYTKHTRDTYVKTSCVIHLLPFLICMLHDAVYSCHAQLKIYTAVNVVKNSELKYFALYGIVFFKALSSSLQIINKCILEK